MENSEKVISTSQTIRNESLKKNKKTNITIDFDFSNIIEMFREKQQKIGQMINADKNIIQQMQIVMLQKQNYISELQGRIEELKEKLKKLQNNNINKQKQERQKFQNLNKLFKLQQNEKIKIIQTNQRLKNQISILQKYNEQQIQDFLRRCLFSQALSIQGFINKIN